MDLIASIYNVPFLIIDPPCIRLRRPSWIAFPGPMLVFAVIMFSYFLVTGGIIYDVIVEPPSIGSTVDEQGHSKPVAFMAYRINGQYIMEGLASSFLFTLGGLGFVILDKSNLQTMPKFNRYLYLFFGFLCVLLSFFSCRAFMTIKLPSNVCCDFLASEAICKVDLEEMQQILEKN